MEKNKLQLKHQTHRETVFRFVGLIAILASYFLYMIWKYDAATGASATILTWSFFVLCTPVADGGFILAFPIRLLFGFRMLKTQIIVWFTAVALNIFMLNTTPEQYDTAFLTSLLKDILTQPYPYWGILVLSALGTVLSIYFGDEMMDVTSHKRRTKHHQHGFKHLILIIVVLGTLTVLAYYHLLSSLGISFDENANNKQAFEVCDENYNRYPSKKAALEAGLSPSQFGATFCPNYKMHPSWDANKDGINDCEDDGSCDGAVDYFQPRLTR